MIVSRRPLTVTTGLIVLAACLLGSTAPAAATPDRVKVGPDLYLQSASAAPEAAHRRSEPSRPGPGERIVGGSATTIAEYPWQAAIAYDETIQAGDGFQRQFCGGTLVAAQIMITAAHCVHDNTTPGFGPPSHYETFTGRTFLSSSEGQVIEWSDYYYFTDALGTPLFNPATFDYDAIFVVLASASASPSVKVAGADEAATWAAGRTARISGWGDQASGANAFPDQLRAAQVQIIGDDFCANPASYGPSFHPQLMLCAGVPAGGVDTCQGDSGGPIVVPVSERGAQARGAFRLVGDTSWGIGCAEAQYPGIYARIAGGTTMGNALQSGIQSVTGQNVYGSGARPLEVPAVRITKAPKNNTETKRGKKRAKVTFKFTSNEPTATFRCQLDGKPAKRCKSPHRLEVKKGRHSMRIVGTNFIGEAGTAATDRFKVKRRK
jgi:secreted trypsin-like serine protease